MFSITPSHIIQYLYCPRFTFFEYVLRIPQYEEKQYKVMQGRELHQRRAEQNRGYLRRRIGATSKVMNCYLTNDLLRGEIDEVLELSDGTLAPLDYKFAKWEGKLYNTYQTQLACYAWLIEENFGKKVSRGFLVYTRSKNYLLDIPITRTDIDAVHEAAKEIRRILQHNFYPIATKVKKRCSHCTYRNICTQ